MNAPNLPSANAPASNPAPAPAAALPTITTTFTPLHVLQLITKQLIREATNARQIPQGQIQAVLPAIPDAWTYCELLSPPPFKIAGWSTPLGNLRYAAWDDALTPDDLTVVSLVSQEESPSTIYWRCPPGNALPLTFEERRRYAYTLYAAMMDWDTGFLDHPVRQGFKQPNKLLTMSHPQDMIQARCYQVVDEMVALYTNGSTVTPDQDRTFQAVTAADPNAVIYNSKRWQGKSSTVYERDFSFEDRFTEICISVTHCKCLATDLMNDKKMKIVIVSPVEWRHIKYNSAAGSIRKAKTLGISIPAGLGNWKQQRLTSATGINNYIGAPPPAHRPLWASNQSLRALVNANLQARQMSHAETMSALDCFANQLSRISTITQVAEGWLDYLNQSLVQYLIQNPVRPIFNWWVMAGDSFPPLLDPAAPILPYSGDVEFIAARYMFQALSIEPHYDTGSGSSGGHEEFVDVNPGFHNDDSGFQEDAQQLSNHEAQLPPVSNDDQHVHFDLDQLITEELERATSSATNRDVNGLMETLDEMTRSPSPSSRLARINDQAASSRMSEGIDSSSRKRRSQEADQDEQGSAAKLSKSA